MEDNKEKLNESLKHIKGLMYYSIEKTGLENKKIIEEGYWDAQGDVSADEIEWIVTKLHKNLKGRWLTRDSKDMERALRLVKNLQGRTYKGGDAIKTVSNEYERLYGTKLVDDVENLDNFKFGGRENKAEFISIINGERASNDTAQDKTSEQKPVTNPWPACPQGTNKFGCQSYLIGRVQAMLGAKVDNKFGKQTQKLLSQKLPEFSQGFSDNDFSVIEKKLTQPHEKLKSTQTPLTVQKPQTVQKPDLSLRPMKGVNDKNSLGERTNMTQGFTKNPLQEQIRDPRILKKIEREKREQERKNKRQ
jgi:hypothetical protein